MPGLNANRQTDTADNRTPYIVRQNPLPWDEQTTALNYEALADWEYHRIDPTRGDLRGLNINTPTDDGLTVRPSSLVVIDEGKPRPPGSLLRWGTPANKD